MATFSQSLQYLVSIQVRGAGKDAAGQPIESWTELRKAWADIRTTGGLEAIRAGAVTAKVNASIRLRYCTDLNASMRVVHGAKAYQVVAVLPDGNRAHLDLLTEIIA